MIDRTGGGFDDVGYPRLRPGGDGFIGPGIVPTVIGDGSLDHLFAGGYGTGDDAPKREAPKKVGTHDLTANEDELNAVLFGRTWAQ